MTAKLGTHPIDATKDDILNGDLRNVFTFDHNTAKKLLTKEGDEYELEVALTFIRN